MAKAVRERGQQNNAVLGRDAGLNGKQRGADLVSCGALAAVRCRQVLVGAVFVFAPDSPDDDLSVALGSPLTSHVTNYC